MHLLISWRMCWYERRVQAVVNELQGEKIDIVKWSDPALVVSNALSPAEVQRVIVIGDKKMM